MEQILAAVGDTRGAEAADRLCESCVDLFGVDAAAISMVFEGTNTGTLGASGPAARAMDELQFTLGEGPCLDSVAHRRPVLVVDLADPEHRRWPVYSPAMLAQHIRGVFAVPVMVAGHYLGALDLFRTAPGILSESTSPAHCSSPNSPRWRSWTCSRPTCTPRSPTPTAPPGPN